MSVDLNEDISALADGEKNSRGTAALLDVIIADPSSRATWERYHLLSNAIRDRLPERLSTGLAERIRDTIAREPAVLGIRPRRSRLRKPLAGLALAASVAAVAIVGVRSLEPDPVANDSRVAVSTRAAPVPGNRWNTSPEIEARLNAYLVNHSEYVGYGMHGMLPYARIVGYDSAE